MSQTLTSGIEFEFLIATLITPENPDPNSPTLIPKIDFPDMGSCPSWNDCADIVALTLTQHGIPTSREGHERAAKSWYLTRDSSIAVNDYIRDYDFELISPILHSSNPCDFEAVEKVANLLREKFRAFTNNTTGFHVHVGNGNQGFPIKTVRNLFAFMSLSSRSIVSIPKIGRRRKMAQIMRRGVNWCLPLQYTIRQKPNLKGKSRREIVDAIMDGYDLAGVDVSVLGDKETHAVKGLGLLCLGWKILERGGLQTQRRTAYNLCTMIKPPWYRKVEFRKYEGTLDGRRAVLWTKFCVALLQFAGRIEWASLKVYLHDEIQKREVTGEEKHISDVCHTIRFDEGREPWSDWAGVRDEGDGSGSGSSTEVASSPPEAN